MAVIIGNKIGYGELEIVRGDTFSKIFGMPWNITGDTYRLQIRQGMDEPLIIEMTFTAIDANNFSMSLTPDQTSAILENTSINLTQVRCLIGAWDLQRTQADGTVTTIAGGKAYLMRDVTKDAE